jgi:hypothetical protein
VSGMYVYRLKNITRRVTRFFFIGVGLFVLTALVTFLVVAVSSLDGHTFHFTHSPLAMLAHHATKNNIIFRRMTLSYESISILIL